MLKRDLKKNILKMVTIFSKSSVSKNKKKVNPRFKIFKYI